MGGDLVVYAAKNRRGLIVKRTAVVGHGRQRQTRERVESRSVRILRLEKGKRYQESSAAGAPPLQGFTNLGQMSSGRVGLAC